MRNLWAPWRKRFIFHGKPKGCIFCVGRAPRRSDARRLLVERGRAAFTVLNLYPYNNGHVMVAPYRHIGALTDLTEREWVEMFKLLRSAIKNIRAILRPHGFNVGFNVGRAAGAGFAQHLHLHIVPRWRGDTNFMPVLSGQKVISQSLKDFMQCWRSRA